MCSDTPALTSHPGSQRTVRSCSDRSALAVADEVVVLALVRRRRRRRFRRRWGRFRRSCRSWNSCSCWCHRCCRRCCRGDGLGGGLRGRLGLGAIEYVCVLLARGAAMSRTKKLTFLLIAARPGCRLRVAARRVSGKRGAKCQQDTQDTQDQHPVFHRRSRRRRNARALTPRAVGALNRLRPYCRARSLLRGGGLCALATTHRHPSWWRSKDQGWVWPGGGSTVRLCVRVCFYNSRLPFLLVHLRACVIMETRMNLDL